MKKALTMVVVFCSVSTMVSAATYTVTGRIKTPVMTVTAVNPLANDVPVRHIRVKVMDEDATTLFPREEGVGYTDADGNFSITFEDSLEAPDVFIDVEYVGQALDGHFIEVRGLNTDVSPIVDRNIEHATHLDIPPGTLALGDLHVFSTRANIVSEMAAALLHIRAAYSGWTQTDDVRVEGRLNDGASSTSHDGRFVSISRDDYDHPGAGNSAFSDIHHELFHWVAYRAYGNRWPPEDPDCDPGSHATDQQTCEGFALSEASADFFQAYSAEPDQKTAPVASPSDWRGTDGSGADNAGDIVEGALALIWTGLQSPGTVIKILLANHPDTIEDFKTAWIALNGTSSSGTKRFFDLAAQNGIVYTRGRFDPQPFQEGPPGDSGRQAAGNFRVIDGIAYIRGKVTPNISLLSKQDLNLAATSRTVAAARKSIGYKPADAGLDDSFLFGFISFTTPVAFTDALVWDTGSGPSHVVDGDYDLIVRIRNAQGWEDTFDPSFAGDGQASINSTERRLKVLRTWFSTEPTPTDDKFGKVVVDNTGPVVTNMKPAP